MKVSARAMKVSSWRPSVLMFLDDVSGFVVCYEVLIGLRSPLSMKALLDWRWTRENLNDCEKPARNRCEVYEVVSYAESVSRTYCTVPGQNN